MKALILGYGSIGQRHAANLRALYPDCGQVVVDPHFEIRGSFTIPDWHQAVEIHNDSAFAVVASPTACHMEQMIELARCGIPFLCEKPPCLEVEIVEYRALAENVEASGLKCAVAFQYRFHKQ